MRNITTSAYTPTEFTIENISDTVAKSVLGLLRSAMESP